MDGALSVSLGDQLWVLKLFIPWRGSQSSGADTVETSTYYTLKSGIPCVWIYGSLVVNVDYSFGVEMTLYSTTRFIATSNSQLVNPPLHAPREHAYTSYGQVPDLER